VSAHSEIVGRVRSAEAAKVAIDTLAEEDQVWIVGGAVRDALFGSDVVDVDLVVSSGDEQRIAREVAAGGRGFAFELSAEHGTWRVVSADRSWHLDVAGLRADDIEGDLRLRDFTINAMAIHLTESAEILIDPTGGEADVEKRVLRAASNQSFSDDPLRLLRAARIATACELVVEPGTIELARIESARAGEPAGERQFAEFSLMLSGRDPMRSLELLDELQVTEHFLPELATLRGVGQNRNHHLDVHGHTLAVLQQLLEAESSLSEYAGAEAMRLDEFLDEVVAEDVTRRVALRIGALFHDIGKPATRLEEGDMVTFMGHDEAGAEITLEICDRFRVGRKLSAYLTSLVRNHLRLGFLIHERPLARRRVYDYLSACDPVAADVTLLSVADRLSARGSGPIASEEMVAAPLDLAKEMFTPALDWHRDGPPSPPLNGDEIVEELNISPGPEVGRIIEELRAATYAGELSGPDEAREMIKGMATQGR
jgi:putative nucleotidyltransferase with HDIG domain